jgi:hypothetical protein
LARARFGDASAEDRNIDDGVAVNTVMQTA